MKGVGDEMMNATMPVGMQTLTRTASPAMWRPAASNPAAAAMGFVPRQDGVSISSQAWQAQPEQPAATSAVQAIQSQPRVDPLQAAVAQSTGMYDGTRASMGIGGALLMESDFSIGAGLLSSGSGSDELTVREAETEVRKAETQVRDGERAVDADDSRLDRLDAQDSALDSEISSLTSAHSSASSRASGLRARASSIRNADAAAGLERAADAAEAKADSLERQIDQAERRQSSIQSQIGTVGQLRATHLRVLGTRNANLVHAEDRLHEAQTREQQAGLQQGGFPVLIKAPPEFQDVNFSMTTSGRPHFYT